MTSSRKVGRDDLRLIFGNVEFIFDFHSHLLEIIQSIEKGDRSPLYKSLALGNLFYFLVCISIYPFFYPMTYHGLILNHLITFFHREIILICICNTLTSKPVRVSGFRNFANPGKLLKFWRVFFFFFSNFSFFLLQNFQWNFWWKKDCTFSSGQAFDITDLLHRPVQRFLKYPLLFEVRSFWPLFFKKRISFFSLQLLFLLEHPEALEAWF